MSKVTTQDKSAPPADPGYIPSASKMAYLCLSLLLAAVIALAGYASYRCAQVTGDQKHLSAQLETLSALVAKQKLQITALEKDTLKLQAENAHHPLPLLRTEVNDLVELAYYSLLVTHRVTTALTLLDLAREKIALSQAPELFKQKRILADAIANLKSYKASFSREKTITRLIGLADRLPSLPPLGSLPQDVATSPTREIASDSAWWVRVWSWFDHAFVVHYDPAKTSQNWSLGQSQWMRQALPWQFMQAEWALLHGDQSAYRSSLQRILGWIPRLYNTESEAVHAALSELRSLSKVIIKPPVLPELRFFLTADDPAS